MKRPSFQFYADAWLGDVALRACSSAARGLWADMLCLMHQGSPYGHLRLKSSSGGFVDPSSERLAKMTGNTTEDVELWLAELDEFGVLGRNKNGSIFSKKLVRDERMRKGWRKRQATRRSKDKPQKPKEISPHDVTRDVTPMSPRSPTPTPTPNKTRKKEDKSALTPQRAVYWDPKPRWSKDHPSLQEAVLHVRPEHLAGLERDFPRVEGNGHGAGGVKAQILRLKRYAITNPSWAKQRKDWVKTLTVWLNNADQHFDDARFKAGQNPANAYTSWEEEAFESPTTEEEKARQQAKIAGCEQEHGQHQDAELKPGSNYAFCRHECGYHRPLEELR